MTTTDDSAAPGASFAVEPGDGEVVVSAIGEVDLDTVREFQAAVDSALEGAPARLIFELGQTSFMDSSGLAVLVMASNRAKVSIRNPSTMVRRVVEISGLAETLGLPE